MALHLIYGSALSKKSEALYRKVLEEAKCHPEKRYFYLVPDQAALAVQADLVRLAGNHVLTNVEPLSFNRFAHRVFSETGMETREIMDDAGKELLIRYIVAQKSREMIKIKSLSKKPGMVRQIISILSEMLVYGIPTDAPKKVSRELEERSQVTLAAKLHDIGIIYENFLPLLHQTKEIAEERLIRLKTALQKWEGASQAVIIADDFTGFTPLQFDVLDTILERCGDLYATGTIRPSTSLEKEKEKSDLFYMTYQMASRLKEMAISHNVSIDEETVSEERDVAPALKHLEAQLYHYPEEAYPEDAAAIQLRVAKNRKDEVANVLYEIRSQIRKGYEYRDLAVICGDPEGYREEFETQFSDADIPYFIDSRRPIDASATADFVSAALRMCSENFSPETVFNFLKNPISVEKAEELLHGADGRFKTYERICEMEQYVRATGKKYFSQYARPWNFRPRNFHADAVGRVEELRSGFFSTVENLQRVIGRVTTVAEKTEALIGFMEDYHVADYKATDDREEKEVLRYIRTFLEQVHRILGNEKMDGDDFGEIVGETVLNLTIGRTPPTKDRVVIGDLTRTRLSHIKKLYIVGANDGLLPPMPDGAGFLNDGDREILRDFSMNLSETATTLSFFNRFYLYLLLTKPSEELWISYCRGEELRPSPLLTELCRLFPRLQEQRVEVNELFQMNSTKTMVNSLSSLMRELMYEEESNEKQKEIKTRIASAAYLYITQYEKDLITDLQPAIDGLKFVYPLHAVSADTIRLLYPNDFLTSATFLEEYASCPYRHYLNHGLAVMDREEYEINDADMGTLLHQAINEYFLYLEAHSLDFAAVPEEESHRIIGEIIGHIAESYKDRILQETARNRFIQARTETIVQRTIDTLQSQWEKGAFTSIQTELRFGTAGRRGIQLPLRNGRSVEITGSIDRLDTAEDDHHVYVKIIDYKSGKNSSKLDFTKIYYGTQLQLLLYLGVAKKLAAERSGKEAIPAGAYYYHLTNPVLDGKEIKSPEEIPAKMMKELSLSGITNQDPAVYKKVDHTEPLAAEVVQSMKQNQDGSWSKNAQVVSTENFNALADFALQKSTDLMDRMISGAIEATPYATSCLYCPYHDICRWQYGLPGCQMRYQTKKTAEDIVKGDCDNG